MVSFKVALILYRETVECGSYTCQEVLAVVRKTPDLLPSLSGKERGVMAAAVNQGV